MTRNERSVIAEESRSRIRRTRSGRSPAITLRTRRRWLAVVVTVVVVGGLFLALVAKGPSRSAGSHAVTLRTAGHKANTPTGEGPPAFTATAVGGQQVVFPSGRPTAVFFMSGLCDTCVAEAQTAAKVQAAFQGRASVLAIDADPTDSAGVIRQFEQSVGVPITYPFVSDPSGRLVVAFGATSTDEWAIVTNAGGPVVYRGQLTYRALSAALVRAGA